MLEKNRRRKKGENARPMPARRRRGLRARQRDFGGLNTIAHIAVFCGRLQKRQTRFRACGIQPRRANTFSRVSVRDQSSRWASRSSSGTLSLNWRIMLLSPEHQKYMVLHELAHTKFMDHSVSFWIFLNRICPNTQKLDREISRLSVEFFAIELA